METKWSKFIIFQRKEIPKQPDFDDKFQEVIKNIEGGFIFPLKFRQGLGFQVLT